MQHMGPPGTALGSDMKQRAGARGWGPGTGSPRPRWPRIACRACRPWVRLRSAVLGCQHVAVCPPTLPPLSGHPASLCLFPLELVACGLG